MHLSPMPSHLHAPCTKVRGPALIRLGYPPNTKGLNEYMATVDPEDEVHNYDKLSDVDYKAIMDAHNRIVALMGGQNPANIIDALAKRKAGGGVDLGAAFEAEPEPEAAEGEEGEGHKEGAPAAEAAAPAVEVS